MRILLDECVPRRLRREFPGHDVHTVPEMGWSGKKNGELLQLMAGQAFEVLLSVDRSICHQQNLQAAGVAIVVLVAPSASYCTRAIVVSGRLLTVGASKQRSRIHRSVEVFAQRPAIPPRPPARAACDERTPS